MQLGCPEPLTSADVLAATYSDDGQPGYWLQQLRRAEWAALLGHAGSAVPPRMTKAWLVEAVLPQYQFEVFTCPERFLARGWAGPRGLLVQFRHGESDWTRGTPEVVAPAQPLGCVNIAAVLACAVVKTPGHSD